MGASLAAQAAQPALNLGKRTPQRCVEGTPAAARALVLAPTMCALALEKKLPPAGPPTSPEDARKRCVERLER